MRKVCIWLLEAIELILLLLVMIVMAPLAFIDELLNKEA